MGLLDEIVGDESSLISCKTAQFSKGGDTHVLLAVLKDKTHREYVVNAAQHPRVLLFGERGYLSEYELEMLQEWDIRNLFD